MTYLPACWRFLISPTRNEEISTWAIELSIAISMSWTGRFSFWSARPDEEQEFLVGWRSTGEQDGQVKVAERTVPSTLVRSLSCIYCFTDAPQEAGGLIGKLLENNYGLPPDTLLALSDAATMKKSRWHCVSSYLSESLFCPFCEGRDFDWEDGGQASMTPRGPCMVCGASVDITGIERFA